MTIQEIRKQLKTSDNPVAKSFHIADHFKVLIFGFNKGMSLEEHEAHQPTKLLILEGEVIYHEGKKASRMKQYDEVKIPAEATHSVSALTDCLILLTQG